MSRHDPSQFLVLLVVLATGAYLIMREGVLRYGSGGARETIYASPMVEDAEVRSDRPGRCSRSGMDLVPLAEARHGAIVHATAPATAVAEQDHGGHGTPVVTAQAATGAQTGGSTR